MDGVILFVQKAVVASADLFLEAAPYMIFGLVVGGLLKVFLPQDSIAKHLGQGRFRSVVNAALLGIPLPLCSCGVLPAAAALKKQGANNGATAAFLIATPESGVDSIAISYALLDPLMTIARPVAALLTALTAGFLENWLNPPWLTVRESSPTQGAIPIPMHFRSAQQAQKLRPRLFLGFRYALGELWADLAGWFFAGTILAGVITVLVPDAAVEHYLGGGISAMLLMLVFGIPLYICATASTPIAAALILKGVSPGSALVFLLVGPATNMASLSVLVALLGRRATGRYLASLAVVSVVCGLVLDAVYVSFGLSAKAVIGQAAEIMPFWVQGLGAGVLLLFSIRPLSKSVRQQWRRYRGSQP